MENFVANAILTTYLGCEINIRKCAMDIQLKEIKVKG